MKVSETYVSSSNFLKAADLENGKQYPLTISAVDLGEVGEGDDKKTQIILTFSNHEKQLGLNKTNAAAIADTLGDETDNWAGQTVNFYRTTTQFGSEIVPCIRVAPALATAEVVSNF